MENPPFEDALPILAWWFQKICVIFTPDKNWGRLDFQFDRRASFFPDGVCEKTTQPVWIFQCHVRSLEVPFLCRKKTWSAVQAWSSQESRGVVPLLASHRCEAESRGFRRFKKSGFFVVEHSCKRNEGG